MIESRPAIFVCPKAAPKIDGSNGRKYVEGVWFERTREVVYKFEKGDKVLWEGEQLVSRQKADVNRKFGELGMIMTESAVDKETNQPFTVIKTGAGEARIPFDQLHCDFSKESTEDSPILIIGTNEVKKIEVHFSSDRSTVSLIDSTATTPVAVANNVPIAELKNYFDAQGNFIAEPGKVATVPETPQPKPEVSEEKPKYAIGEMPPQTGDPVSLADALIMYSHIDIDGVMKAQVEAQIARCFVGQNADYEKIGFPSIARDIIVLAAKDKVEAFNKVLNYDQKIDEDEAKARAEVEKITNMIPRLQKALKGEGLTLEKVKGELEKPQTIDELETFIKQHEQRAQEIRAERARVLEEAKVKKAQTQAVVETKKAEMREASYKAMLGEEIRKHHSTVREEFMKGVDSPEKAREFTNALDEFSAASKSVFSPEQAAELLSQVKPKTTDALHDLALHVRELSSFEKMIDGMQQSVVLPASSLRAPIAQSVESLQARATALDAGLKAIKEQNMFVTDGKERVLELKNERYKEPIMREYAERVYQKAEETEREMLAQQHTIDELLKRAKAMPVREIATLTTPPLPEAGQALLSEADFENRTPASDKFFNNFFDLFKDKEPTIEEMVKVLQKVDPGALDAIPKTLSFNAYRHIQLFDEACRKITSDQTLLKEINESLSSKVKDMLQRSKDFPISSQQQNIDIFSDKSSYYYKYHEMAVPLLQNNIERLQNAGYDSLEKARNVGVLVDSDGKESVVNWPILAKGKEIAGERSFGGLLGKLMSPDTDAETKTKILSVLNRVGQIPYNKSDIERALVEVDIPTEQFPHGLILIEETENGGLMLQLNEPTIKESTPSAFDVHGFIEEAQKTSPYEFWKEASGMIDQISDASDYQAEEVFQSEVMKKRCELIPNADIFIAERGGMYIGKIMGETKIMDFVLPVEGSTYDNIQTIATAFAFSDPALKAEAGIRTFRESRLFSVWFMEALRDVKEINKVAENDKVFFDTENKLEGFKIFGAGDKKLRDLTVLEYMHLQAKNFQDIAAQDATPKFPWEIRKAIDVWMPNRIHGSDGALILIRRAGKDGQNLQFNITGGKTPSTWGEFDLVGIQIPKDIAETPGFSPSSTAEIPLNRVQFKDGVIEIIAEAPQVP